MPNYLVWVSQFLPILRYHDLLNIVDGSESYSSKLVLDKESNDYNRSRIFSIEQERQAFVEMDKFDYV